MWQGWGRFGNGVPGLEVTGSMPWSPLSPCCARQGWLCTKSLSCCSSRAVPAAPGMAQSHSAQPLWVLHTSGDALPDRCPKRAVPESFCHPLGTPQLWMGWVSSACALPGDPSWDPISLGLPSSLPVATRKGEQCPTLTDHCSSAPLCSSTCLNSALH